MTNFKTLLTSNNKELIFSTKTFKNHLQLYKNTHSNLTYERIFSDLSEYCNVSSETVRKWYRGHNGPSDLVIVKKIGSFLSIEFYKLLEEKISTENILTEVIESLIEERNSNNMFNSSINFNTVKFIGMLNELSSKAENGFIDFKDVTPENNDHAKIVYSLLPNDPTKARVALDYLVTDDHHDLISYYDDYIVCDDYYEVYVIFDKYNDEPFIRVTSPSTDTEFIVEPGNWYFC